MDTIYQEDSSHMAYRAYCRFEKFERQESMNFQAFVSEFAKLYENLKRHKMELPEAVLAYRILNSANLSSEKLDLALATVKQSGIKETRISRKQEFEFTFLYTIYS